jgi:hypothetical protein
MLGIWETSSKASTMPTPNMGYLCPAPELAACQNGCVSGIGPCSLNLELCLT